MFRVMIIGTMTIMAIVIIMTANFMITEKNSQQEKEFEIKQIARSLKTAMTGHAWHNENMYTDNEKDLAVYFRKSSNIFTNIQFGKKASIPGEVGIIFIYQEGIVVDYIINGIGIDGQEIIILTKDKFL